MRIVQFISLLLFLNIQTFAQITIDFPVSRIVFQRNSSNFAQVEIAGSYSIDIEKIEARAEPVTSAQGNDTGWITIADISTKGNFHNKINVSAGWYNIQVRAIRGSQVVAFSQVNKVGVGEVFIVAGQSNAEGQNVYFEGNRGTTEDRVSCINYKKQDGILSEEELPFEFSQMGDNMKVAPYNPVPWFWARLGERIVKSENIPVLFYGAAVGGTESSLWKRSALGEDLSQSHALFVKVPGMPYRGIQAALRYYASRTGIRAILWQQGESDSYTSSFDYYNNVRTVINKTREDIGNGNLAWVIARSSKNPSVWPNVITGQNLIISNTTNVFYGPETDVINERDDLGIHFQGQGLAKAAELWYNAIIGSNLFSRSTPIMPLPLLNVQVSCNPVIEIPYTLKVEDGFKEYKWSDGRTEQVLNVSNATLSIKAKNTLNIPLYSPIIRVEKKVEIPTIYADGSLSLCPGETTELRADFENNLKWSTGATTRKITVSKEGEFNVTRTNVNGCIYTSSNVQVFQLTKPSVEIIPNGATEFCEGGNVELEANASFSAYNWSNGERTKSIKAATSGVYTLFVKDNNGCVSDNKQIKVTSNPLPTTQILTDKKKLLCEGEEIKLIAANAFATYQWNNGSTDSLITVNKGGDYTLIVTDDKGCKSLPVEVKIKMAEQPETPQIAQISPFTLVAENLSTAPVNWYLNNTLQQGVNAIFKVTQNGVYSAQSLKTTVVENDTVTCKSGFSNKLLIELPQDEKKIKMVPNPVTDGILLIESKDTLKNLVLVIRNDKGQLMGRVTIPELNSIQRIDMTNYPAGTYLIHIQNDSVFQIEKIVVIK